MPKSPKEFPFVVFLEPLKAKDPVILRRWKPTGAGITMNLEIAMVPAFQRGGISGDFQNLTGDAKQDLQAFIPWHRVIEVVPRSDWERLHGEGVE